jgi:hypothetical protein
VNKDCPGEAFKTKLSTVPYIYWQKMQIPIPAASVPLMIFSLRQIVVNKLHRKIKVRNYWNFLSY